MNQLDALHIANAAMSQAECVFEDVRDMSNEDDAHAIVLHIEAVERNLANLKAALRSPDFHVRGESEFDVDSYIADRERGLDQILDERERTGL